MGLHPRVVSNGTVRRNVRQKVGAGFPHWSGRWHGKIEVRRGIANNGALQVRGLRVAKWATNHGRPAAVTRAPRPPKSKWAVPLTAKVVTSHVPSGCFVTRLAGACAA